MKAALPLLNNNNNRLITVSSTVSKVRSKIQNTIQIIIMNDKHMWDRGTTGLEYGMYKCFSFINNSVFCVSCKPAAKWFFSEMWVYKKNSMV